MRLKDESSPRATLLGAEGPLGVFVKYPVLMRLAAISVFAEIGWATLLVVLQFHFKDELLYGFTPQFIGVRMATVTFAFVACETILKFPMGKLSDKLGPRPLVFFALGLSTITPLLMTRAVLWWHFVPLRFLDGIAAAALWPAMSSLMARSVPREAKSAAMSVFNGAYCLGLAVGPMAGLYLGHRYGNVSVFPMCSVVMGCGLIIAMTVLTGELGTAAPNDENEGITLKEHPLLKRMLVLYALSQAAVGLIASVLVLYVDDQFGIKEKHLPSLMLVPALFVAVLAVPIGHLADKIGRPLAVKISYVAASLGMVIVAATSFFKPSTGLLAVPVLVFGTGMMLLVVSYILGTPAWLGLASVQVDEAHQAKVLSLMQTAQGFGLVLGLGVVMGAGPLLVRYHQWRNVMSHRLPHWKSTGPVHEFITQFRLHFHFPQHSNTAIVTSDVVPIVVWFWASALVFFLCLLGTLLWLHDSSHSHEGEAGPVQQPTSGLEV